MAKRYVAIIPARGGSKRIPRKNIRNFRGQPMIAYSINAAKQSSVFDEIVVSTDDQEIADIANKYGAEVPFLRDRNISGDHVGTLPVIQDAIKRLGLPEKTVVCCLYPTAPLLRGHILGNASRLINHPSRPNYVCAVGKYSYPIQRALRIDNKTGLMEMIEAQNLQIFSQELEDTYHDAGQFYFGLASTWIESLPMLTKTIGIILPNWLVQDIDTEEDWEKAVFLHRFGENKDFNWSSIKLSITK